MNLQELIDKPGYGSHVEILQKEGKWDEYAGLPKQQFDVFVSGSVNHYHTYKITARHVDEAEDIAMKTASNDFDVIDDVDVNPAETK